VALLDRIAAFGDPPPLVVFTGGDPLRRPDITTLVAEGTRRGLVVSLTPSGTAAATESRLRALKEAGLARLAVSLDGATAVTHDAFRRVRGSHRYTLRIIEHARALGLPLQINSTVCRQTVGELPALLDQVTEMGVLLWALFFLIPVGRAQADQALGADEIEEVLRWAAKSQRRVPFGIKTTEAPQYQRVLLADAPHGSPAAWGSAGASLASRSQGRGERIPEIGPPQLTMRAGRAVTDGNGFVFVDHVGNICPSGFLPLVAGNVRRDDLVAIYREHPLFLSLRDPDRLGGRCGRCEWRHRCGGSRARAYAQGGGPLAEDPGCPYQPAARERAS
jgi:MoaA/NifB/PqqE/SkfB family radical SAM enzyme